MQFKQSSFNGVEYIAPSWEEMGRGVFEVFKKIDKAGRKYDRVVALGKGGWTWARALCDLLMIEELDSVRIKLYEGINERADKANILRPLSIGVKGENVLIFDDLVDSGTTMELAKKHVFEHGAKSVETATLFFKPRSSVKPDFYAFKTDTWVIFPHEIREFIDETSRKWRKSGLSEKKILNRYLKLGLNQPQISYFMSKRT